MKNILKKIIVVAFCFFSFFSFPVNAEEEDAEETIHTRFFAVTTKQNADLEVPFNRNWFKQDARIYSHDLAKLSLGLATAAFRPVKGQEEYGTITDENLISFLKEAHFTDLRSDDYDKDPSMYTISTVMGHQKIGEGEDAFELIAVGVCGQGYVDEWESNFTIGSGKTHDGFSRSSDLVYDRIFGYIASAKLEGPYKIWISGFSRAGAVSNLTAAMLTDSDYFEQKDVFAYTFGTPRTVVDPNYVKYRNIFNIVGKADPVPNVPFADWGYERYGTTLYLPALETDSDFKQKREKANVVYKQLTGIDYWYNPGANNTIRTVLSYLLEICPKPTVYSRSLQNKLIHIWEDKTPINVLRNLLDIANDRVLITEDNREEANALLNYMLLQILDYTNRESTFRRWNTSASTAGNIAQAHTPELYVSWLFSTDSAEELYSGYLKYSIVYIESIYTVELLRGDEVIEMLDPVYGPNGIVLIRKKDRKAPENYIYLEYVEDQIRAIIPEDADYTLRFDANGQEGHVTLLELYNTVGYFKDNDITLYSYELEGDDVFSAIYTRAGENEFETKKPFDESRFYMSSVTMSTSITVDMVRGQANRIYWRDWVIILISIAILIVTLVLFQLTYLIGKIRFNRKVKKGWIAEGTKYRVLPLLCSFLIFLLFLIMEFFSALFPESTRVLYIFKFAIGSLSILVALSGYLRRKKPLSLFIVIDLCILTVADIMTTHYPQIGAFLHVLAYGFLSYGFIREDRPEKHQIIIWAVLSVIGVIGLSFIDGEYGVLRFAAMLFLSVSLLMVCTSFALPRRVFTGALLLFAAGIMVMYNEIHGRTFFSHILSLGTYYLAIATLASTNTRVILPKLVPEAVEEELQ